MIPFLVLLILSVKLKDRSSQERPQESEQPDAFLLFCGWEKRYMALGEKVRWVNEKVGHEKVGCSHSRHVRRQ